MWQKRNKITPSRNVYGAQFNIAFALGRWDEAHQAADGFARSAEAGYPRGMGYRMRMTGHELLARGEYEGAVDAYRQAIAQYQQHSPDERDVRTVEPYLGWAMIEAGDDLAARPLLESVCDFWKGRQAARYARGLCCLSTHFLRRGNSDQAIPLLRQALVAIEKTTSDLPWPVRPQVSLTLARALLMAGEKEEALSHAQWAYDFYKKMGHFLSGEAAFWLGKVYEGFNKPALSDRFFQEARLRWTDLGLEHLLRRGRG